MLTNSKDSELSQKSGTTILNELDIQLYDKVFNLLLRQILIEIGGFNLEPLIPQEYEMNIYL